MIIPKPDGYKLVMIGSIERPNYKIAKMENEPTRGEISMEIYKMAQGEMKYLRV